VSNNRLQPAWVKCRVVSMGHVPATTERKRGRSIRQRRTVIEQQPRTWKFELERTLLALQHNEALEFSNMTPSQLPAQGGVYLICARLDGVEIPYYVGRTTNLRRRLYANHLMGPFANARLKKQLVDDKSCSSVHDAKQFIGIFCNARWVQESDWRRRGAFEAYATAVLFPKYGIDKEH